MTVSPVASSEKIQTALTNLGTPNGFIAYDVVPLLQQLVVALGNVSSGGGGGSSAITGEVKIWTTASAPTGYLLCDGSAVSRTTYASLFAVIGTTYGTGDGSTTFNIPDFRDKAPVGNGSGGPFSTLGASVGNYDYSIASADLPILQTTNTDQLTLGSNVTAVASVAYSGTGAPISLIQPSLVVNFIIKT